MPKPPKGMFRRKGRKGWYIRVFRGGRERLVGLGDRLPGKARSGRFSPPVA